jgi:hypothetical protein
MGAILGACCIGPTHLAGAWPTPEMAVRGNCQNVLIALPVASFSGVGVAASSLDDQTSSLVSVAISALLFPPAVNAGILCVAFAFLRKVSHDGFYPWRPFELPITKRPKKKRLGDEH